MHRSDVACVAMLVSFVLAAGAAATALAQPDDISVSAGYSHIELDDAGNLLHGKDGPYVDLDFSFEVPKQSLPVFVGFGLTGSGYFDSQDTTFRLSPTTTGTATLYSDLGLFEIEPR